MNANDFSFVIVPEFLEELGMRNISRDGAEWKFSCPFPGHKHGDSNPSASMQEETTLFHCFGCGAGGNAVTFLAELEGISRQKSRRFINDRFGDGFHEPQTTFSDEIEARLAKGERAIKGLRRNVILDEEECERRSFSFAGRHYRIGPEAGPIDYLLNRGLSVNSINEFEWGYDIISDRPCFPIRDIDGNLIGFKARSYKEDQTPRYKILGGPEYGFEPYEASRAIWGIHNIAFTTFTVDDVIYGNEIIVCEGELNAMMLRQNGFLSAIGISGKILSSWQADLIKNLTGRVILIFDEDVDALRAAEKLQAINVKIVLERPSDPAEWDEDMVIEYVGGAVSPLAIATRKLI